MENHGEGRPNLWVPSTTPSNLPPKAPSTIFDSGNALLMGLAGRNMSYKQQHQRTPSASFIPQINLSWIDDMLESPRRGSHRRSASDSVAVSDPSCDSTPSEKATEPKRPIGQSLHYDRLDEEQLFGMFEDVEPCQKQRCQSEAGFSDRIASLNDPKPSAALDNWMLDKGNAPAASENPSTPSDSNSVNEISNEDRKSGGGLGFLNSDPETQSMSESDGSFQTKGNITASSKMELDTSMDPKRAKRILANRQSAQRSRVRKLQYIAELERSVNALQVEVSSLTPQVAFLDHQRAILNMDNNAMKQRISSLIQDRRFKDAHNEALQKEIQKLRLIFQQNQQQQFSKLGMDLQAESETKPISDSVDGFLKGGIGLLDESTIAAAAAEGNSLSPDYLIAGDGKSGDSRNMAESLGSEHLPTELSVQNAWSYTN